ncbi:MAG: hypothetical protein J6K78_05700 [Tidjanibacter sp.]|nr:hypothetical protein [Tidjanibacter sp.]
MKKLFFIIIGLCALTLTACEKESIESIDLSLVSAEVELECIAEEIDYPNTSHTILCSGKVGGFNGKAFIDVEGIIDGSKSIVVAGSETSFSFTIKDRLSGSYTGTPQTFSVTIYADVNGDGHVYSLNEDIVFQSSVVIIL